MRAAAQHFRLRPAYYTQLSPCRCVPLGHILALWPNYSGLPPTSCCNAPYSGGRRYLVRQRLTPWSRSHDTPPDLLRLIKRGVGRTGDLNCYSARLGIVPSFLARHDADELPHVTNEAGMISRATAQAAQRRLLQLHPRDGYVSPRPSAAFVPKTTGQAGQSTTWTTVVGSCSV